MSVDMTPATPPAIPAKPALYLTATQSDAAALKLRQFNAEKVDPAGDINGALINYCAHDLYLLPTEHSRQDFAQLAARLVSLGNDVYVAPIGADAATVTADAFTRILAPVPAERKVRSPAKGSASETTRDKWRELGLEIAHNGVPFDNLDNACRALESAAPDIWFDEFLKLGQYAIHCEQRPFLASDVTTLTVWFQRNLGMRRMSARTVKAACEWYMAAHKRNCAQDWLRSLSWDATPRLNWLAHTGFGTPDDDFHSLALKCFLMGMCKRILEPGCQVDFMPVFEGTTGIKKSSALRAIGGQWFAEYRGNLQNVKQFQELLRGKMLVNFSELAAILKVDRELMDGIVTDRVDTFRKSFGEDSQDYPRMCVFAGDTNTRDWNYSDVGARRYLPIECSVIDYDWIVANREQLFAEAAARLAAGESYWDIPMQEQTARADERRAGDAWEGLITRYCTGRKSVTIEEIFTSCLEIEKGRASNADAKRIRSVLTVIQWASGKTEWRDGRTVRVWSAPTYATDRMAQIAAQQPTPQQPTPPESLFDDDGDPAIPF